MDKYLTREKLFDAFMRHEVSAKDAVEVLEKQFNMSNEEAKALVKAWEH